MICYCIHWTNVSLQFWFHMITYLLIVTAKQVRNKVTVTKLMWVGEACQYMMFNKSQSYIRFIQALSYPYVKLCFPCFKQVKFGFSLVLSVAKSELLIYSTRIIASSIQSLQKTIVSVCMTFFFPSVVVLIRIQFWDRTVFLKSFFFEMDMYK